jgi:hypothetical protein
VSKFVVFRCSRASRDSGHRAHGHGNFDVGLLSRPATPASSVSIDSLLTELVLSNIEDIAVDSENVARSSSNDTVSSQQERVRVQSRKRSSRYLSPSKT